jgi:hypothetical protein
MVLLRTADGRGAEVNPHNEGAGWRAPKPIRIFLSLSEAEFLRLTAVRIAEARRYDRENVRVGLLGEGALGKFVLRELKLPYVTQAQVHLDPTYHGDGGVDATIYGQRVQIKTHRKGGRNAVTRFRRKKAQPIRADLFVFCEHKSDVPCLVNLNGWVYQRELLHYGRIDVRDKYSLLVIDSKILRPMCEMIALLSARRALIDQKETA